MFRPLFPTTALLLGLTLLGADASAAPPQINGITPYGLQRGVPSEVTINGANLAGNPRLIASFKFTLTPPPGADAGNWKPKLVVEPGTAIGVYPVRVLTDEGLSNPFLFAVGQLPQVTEKEDNSTFEQAQIFTSPSVIEGQAAGNDVDYYRFAGKKGQKIVVDAQCARIGSGVDPSIRLTTAGRKFVASADDSPGMLTDARLVAVLPEDGDYVVELSDSRYQGVGRPVYRLVVGELPLAEEIFPIGGRSGEAIGLELRGGTLDGVKLAAARLEPWLGVPLAPIRVSGAGLGLPGPAAGLDFESLPSLTVSGVPELREPADASAPPLRAAFPVVLNGRIDPAGDEDRFTLVVIPGQKIQIDVEAAESGSALDGVLQVLNPKGGAVLATADDTVSVINKKAGARPPGIVSPDPSLAFTIPAGVTEITLALKDLEGRGGIGHPYRINVSPTGPTFEVSPNNAQISVPKGGTASIPVTVARKGYTGPITLKVLNPPAGVTVREGTIGDNQLVGVCTVSASADAAFGPLSLSVAGEGKGAEGPIVVRASKSIVFAQQGTLPTNAMAQEGVAASSSSALAVSLDAPAAPVEVAHGFGAPVAIKATRGKEPVGALALTALPLPPGVTVAPAALKEKDAEVQVTLSTTTDVPLGDLSIGLVAQGTVAGAGRTIAVPAVTFRVVRPATVELAAPAVELKAGATAEVKGKVVRKGAFKEPVTVKLNGLPAGLKADPVTVAADKAEFTIKIVADPKSAAATASASVALAFQVNKKDYPPPTAPLSVKVAPAK